MNKYSLSFLIIISILTFLQFNCQSPTEPNNNLSITIEDVSCTEAWIKVTGETGSELVLNRDGTEAQKFTLTTSPQIIYDDSLLPSKTYTYQVVSNNKTSNNITVTTLDTTSNDFTWQTYTFGDPGAGSSILNDIAIVNDTLAYAVGEVYLNDSTGQPDPNAYNLAKWDGHSWRLLRVQFYTFCGQQQTGSYRANAIAILNDTTVWIASNNSEITVWNGERQTGIMCLPVSVSKVWPVSPNEVYTVGAIGQIGHYSNGSWQKIVSGTSLNITDIYSTPYSSSIFMSLYNTSSSLAGHSLLKLTSSDKVEEMSTPNNLFEALSVWNKNNDLVFVAGTGLFRYSYGKWDEINEFSNRSLTCVRANGLNDIVVTGATRSGHFNGKSWQIINELILANGVYGSVDIKDNLLIAVGQNNPQAVIILGKRTN